MLDLLDGREMTSVEIIQAIQRDFPQKNYTIQTLQGFIDKLRQNRYIKRMHVTEKREDGCRFLYTTTTVGKKKSKYYKLKVNI